MGEMPALAAAAYGPPSAWRSLWTYSTSLVGIRRGRQDRPQAARQWRFGSTWPTGTYEGYSGPGLDRQYVYAPFVLSLLAELIR